MKLGGALRTILPDDATYSTGVGSCLEDGNLVVALHYNHPMNGRVRQTKITSRLKHAIDNLWLEAGYRSE